MAAELRAEGHTQEEIAAMLKVEQETVRELLTPISSEALARERSDAAGAKAR